VTTFRCLRNFYFAGRGDCRVGELLELNDDQARELVALGGPVSAKDCRRVVAGPNRIEWESPADTRRRQDEGATRLRAVGTMDSRRPIAA
jgi:hypothetical protein